MRAVDSSGVARTLVRLSWNLTWVLLLSFFLRTTPSRGSACPVAETTLTWNTSGAPYSSRTTNNGGLGIQGDPGNLVWGSDPFGEIGGTIYDGGLLVTGDSAIVRLTFFHRRDNYVPQPSLTDGTCGIAYQDDVFLGYHRIGGTPGIAVPVTGDIVKVAFTDTNLSATPGTPQASLGLFIIQTEVAANDPVYGDFKLYRWELRERNGSTVVGLHVGSYIDWDVPPNFATNLAKLWPDGVRGYAVWDQASPGYAYGMLDPAQPASRCGDDPIGNPIYGMLSLDHNSRGLVPGPDEWLWSVAHNESPLYTNDGQGDRALMLIGDGIDLGPYGSAAVHQALYAIDARNGLTDTTLMKQDALNVAKRAALWGGWARGDVNADGCIDHADVAWLDYVLSGLPDFVIYPDEYNADVNLDGVVNYDDYDYLNAYVLGSGPAPLGQWRFESPEPPTCSCPCHGDPDCTGFVNVLDVVIAVRAAFEDISPAPDPDCPYTNTDVDCTGFTNILDVVKMVNVAFRGAFAETEFCDPCPP